MSIEIEIPTNDHESQKAVDRDLCKGDAVTGLQQRNRLLQLLIQQIVVIRSLLIVANVAIATQIYPLPFLSNELRKDMLQGTIIFMVGDWCAQLLTHWKKQEAVDRKGSRNNGASSGKRIKRRKKKHPLFLGTFEVDNNRFVISTILGAFWAGIANPSVYAAVENMLPGVSLKLVLVKMAITCSILSTAGNFTTMMFRRLVKQLWETPNRLEAAYPIFRSCVKSCRDDFLDVLKDDLKIFPAYDILCYSVIPPSVRPLTNALIASAWAMYMSIASANTTTNAPVSEAKMIDL
ncbi:hypothetical protein ACHAWF_003002 [Thalassiosira exigua]